MSIRIDRGVLKSIIASDLEREGRFVSEASYIVYPDDPANPSMYYVKNGRTGQTEYGSSNAMMAIQFAIDKVNALGGGVVLLKRGYYPVAGTISLRDNVSLVGEGWQTFIERTVVENTAVIEVLGVRNVNIMSLKVSGGEPAETTSKAAAAIRVAGGSKNVVVANVYARGATYPIYVGGASPDNWTEDVIVYGNITEYANDDCITATGYARRIIIANNIARFSKNTTPFRNSGIELDDTVFDAVVEGNVVYGNYDGQIDVHLHNPPVWPADAPVNQRIVIRGNVAVSRYRIDGTGADTGITLNADAMERLQGVDFVVEGNISFGFMTVRGFERVVVKNNLITPGVIIGHNVNTTKALTKDVVFEGNIVIGNDQIDGIFIGYVDRANVANNIVIGGKPAINVTGLAKNVAVRGNYVYNDFATLRWPYGSIHIGSSGTIVEGNWVVDDRAPADKKSRGIVVRNVRDVVVRNNVIDGSTVGIWAYVDTGYDTDRLVIEGNRVVNIYTAYHGIYIVDNACPTMCVIKDNFVDNVTSDTAYPRCIFVGNGNKVYITGNRLGVSRDGRRIQVNDSEAYILGNILFAGGSIGIYTTKPYIIRRNVGYRTENSGVATITAGSTKVTVSHGLASAPSKVLVTPLGNIRVWVENITSTTFDIVTDTAPSADTNVTWYAEV